MRVREDRVRTRVRLTDQRKKTLLLYLRRELRGDAAPTEPEIRDLHSWKFVQNAQEHLRHLEEVGLLERVRVDKRFEPKHRWSIRRLTLEGRRVANILNQKTLEKEAVRRKTNHMRLRSLMETR